jgi:DNA/RNA-binding domain of Phe-tRNA-synthetase-like protein
MTTDKGKSFMYFQHSSRVRSEYPGLVAGVVHAAGISGDVSVADQVARFWSVAEKRLAAGSESEFPEIQAWRRAFSQMGLKPTQYRCASESLLRRFRKERALPTIHPLIDLCNAVSLAYATPIAALDVSRISGPLEVRHATGDERYLAFSGETQNPVPDEIVFVDAANEAHARRWTNRQSGHSAVSDSTTEVLIVAEALHDSAPADVPELTATLAAELSARWPVTPRTAILTAASPLFDDFGPGAAP